jgi:hypothetical protein
MMIGSTLGSAGRDIGDEMGVPLGDSISVVQDVRAKRSRVRTLIFMAVLLSLSPRLGSIRNK